MRNDSHQWMGKSKNEMIFARKRYFFHLFLVCAAVEA